ncbi:O-antigen ligase family protein [Streptomyces sp. SKN60]|uniref:O-antigen ligase family protein n=1 Tax=Streptomyces sp. SKN60 TaxID=2855506 RepID=UPI0022450D44|nr:O-antigen ligase family protein [Streptomyces sp. SKN60]MCX2183849.1 O-antigen ligase family protein [Streptomyces sp. SKN60]
MSIAEIFRVLGRRWYVTVPMVLLSLLAGGYLYTTVPVTYESQSQLALLNSSRVARPAPSYGNTLAYASGSLIGTADVLIRALQSAETVQELRGHGITDEYAVDFAAQAEGPLLTLTVKGDDRDRVLAETRRLTDYAAEQLQQLQEQARVPDGYYVESARIVPAQKPVSQPKSRYQKVAAVVVFGVAGGFVLAFVVEICSAARRRARGLAGFHDAPPVPRPGAGRLRRLLDRPLDATAVLTGYLALALFLPSNLALPALGGAGTPANVFALLGLFWYLATWCLGRIAPAPGTRPMRVVMLVLTVTMLLSYITNQDRISTQKEILAADRGLIVLLVWVSLVVLTTAGIQDRERLDVLLRRLVVMGSVVAALGLYDFFTGTNIADSLRIPGLNSSTASVSVMDRGSFTRPRSLTAHPLEFSGMLAILLPFAIWHAFDPAREHLGRFKRWAPVVLLGGGLPLTVSRTSIIGVAVVVLIMVPRWRPQRRWTAIGILFGAVAVFKVLVPGLIGTITGLFSGSLNNADSSTQARTIKYPKIYEYFVQDPVFGRGFGTFTPERYFFTDNQYLLTVAELGALGVACLLLLGLAGVHNGGALRRLARTESDRELGQAFFASSMVALVISATFDTLSFPMFAGVFFLLIGLGGSALGFVRREADAKPASPADPASPAEPPPSASPAPSARTPDSPRLVEI